MQNYQRQTSDPEAEGADIWAIVSQADRAYQQGPTD